MPVQAPTGNCLDWDGLTSVELQRRWQFLGNWVQGYLVGRLQYPVPWCWPHHPAMVDELKAFWCWHQEIINSGSPSAEDLVRFHETARRSLSEWRKPCPKNVSGDGKDATARMIAADAQDTARLLERVAREEYLARTKARA